MERVARSTPDPTLSLLFLHRDVGRGMDGRPYRVGGSPFSLPGKDVCLVGLDPSPEPDPA